MREKFVYIAFFAGLLLFLILMYFRSGLGVSIFFLMLCFIVFIIPVSKILLIKFGKYFLNRSQKIVKNIEYSFYGKDNYFTLPWFATN